MAYYRGFKAEAERLAMSTRQELGLGAYRRLDPSRLADHLGIDILSLRDLKALVSAGSDLVEAIDILRGAEAAALSAATVFDGPRRIIVYNDRHPLGRQANSITHELSHGLLLHPSAPALDRRGCRNWNADLEDQADYLAGALLIPSKAAWWIAKRRLSFEQAADDYGCSIELVRWRINITGARRLIAG